MKLNGNKNDNDNFLEKKCIWEYSLDSDVGSYMSILDEFPYGFL